MDRRYGPVMSPVETHGQKTPTNPFHAPRKRAPEISENNVSGQADVTIALFVHQQLMAYRKHSAQDPNARPLGTDVSYDNLAVKEDDLMMVQANWSTVARMSEGEVASPWTFSSLTGIDTHPDYIHSQEDFEDNFVVVGRAKAGYSLDDPQKMNRGQIPIQISGSATVRNNGSTSFNVGDLVTWRAYSINPAVRAQEVASGVTKALGEPAHKFSPILEKQKYTSMYRFPQQAMALFLSTYSKDASLMTTSVRTAILNKQSQSELFFLSALRNPSTMGTFLALSVLVQAGTIAVNDLSPESMREVAELDLDALNSKAFVFGDGTVRPTDTPRETLAQQERNWESLLSIGKLLGVVPGGTVATGLVSAIIQRQNMGLIEGADLKHHRDNASVLKVAPTGRQQAQHALSQDYGVESGLQRDQINFARDQFAEFYNAYMQAQKRIIGKAIGPAEPGQRLDIILG